MEFSKDVQDWFVENFGDIDIEKLSLKELKELKDSVISKRNNLSSMELGQKLKGNSGYGACGNPGFYFYNPSLAGDITGECRYLTKFMIDKVEHFFKYELWDRKDLWEKLDIDLDESKRNFLIDKHIWIYSDTDSAYYQYGDLFKCMTEDWHKRYPTDEDKIKWIVRFNKEFLDKQNNLWLDEMYGARHAKNIHEFEMEAICKIQLNLAKKKYLKAVQWNKGALYDHPKTKGTGIELVKTTTPPLARKQLTELVNLLMFDYNKMSHQEFVLFFQDKLNEFKKEFFAAPIDEISQSIGVNGYKKYVINDETALEFTLRATPGVKGCARYNYLAHKNGEDDKRIYSGKLKIYNIRTGPKTTDFFAYPFGECPSWAPKIDLTTQWDKTIIQPINRFLEVMNIPLADKYGLQRSLFDEF